MTESEPVAAEEVSASTDPAVETEPTATDESVVIAESATVKDSVTVEAASDAELRAWAKDNGIDGVPTSGKLSTSWREQITAAMAAALDPKAEASVEATPPESSTSVETMTEEKETGFGESSTQTKPEFEPVEYRSVFQAPNTFVTSQTFTA